MLWKNITLFAASAIVINTTALAQQAPRPVTFEQLKESCLNPGRFQNQNPPANIRVRCSSESLDWIPGAARETSLEASSRLTSSLQADKFSVSANTRNIARPESTFACPTFQQVRREFTSERVVTCAELADVTSLHQLCLTEIDEQTRDNPDATVETPTGLVASGCNLSRSGNGNGQNDNGNGLTVNFDYE